MNTCDYNSLLHTETIPKRLNLHVVLFILFIYFVVKRMSYAKVVGNLDSTYKKNSINNNMCVCTVKITLSESTGVCVILFYLHCQSTHHWCTFTSRLKYATTHLLFLYSVNVGGYYLLLP